MNINCSRRWWVTISRYNEYIWLSSENLGCDDVVSSTGDSACVTVLYIGRYVERWMYPWRNGIRSTDLCCPVRESSITSHHSVSVYLIVHYRSICASHFRLMGLPDESDWPEDSPIRRQAFENDSKQIISLERLIRFPDSCAFDLLRVSSVLVNVQYCTVDLVATVIQTKSSSHRQSRFGTPIFPSNRS